MNFFDTASYQLTAYNLPLLIAGAMALLMGLLMLLRERSRAAELYFVQCLGASLWFTFQGLCMAVVDGNLSPADRDALATLWGKLFIVGVSLVMPAAYQFALTIVGGTQRRLFGYLLWIPFLLVIGLLLQGDLMVAGVVENDWGRYPLLGPLAGIMNTLQVAAGVLILSEFWRARRLAPANSLLRQRASICLGAALIGTLMIIDYFTAYGSAIYPPGFLAMLSYLLIIGWMLWRHGQLDLNVELIGNRLIETMRDAVLVTDLDGRIQLANAAASRNLDRSIQDLQDVSLASLTDERLAPDTLPSQLEDGRYLEVELHNRQGQQAHFMVSGTLLHNERKRPLGWVLVMTDISARKQAERAALHAATHDALTGLPNRKLLKDYLDAALLHSREQEDADFAVLYLDVDRFKRINDRWGHAAGDQLLIDLSRRLSASLEPGDQLARLAGDEFAMLIHSTGRLENLEALGEHFTRLVASAPFNVNGQPLDVSISLGLISAGAEASSTDALLHNADTAMYQAKQGGRASYRVFSRGMGDAAKHRINLEAEMQMALREGRFELHYQPILSLRQRQVCGFEALLRWRHPQRGLLAPNEFIGLAENSNLIVSIGAWVQEQLLRDLQSWPINDPAYADLYVTVNVSDREFTDPEFVARCAATCAAMPAGGGQRLRLELTERVLADDRERALAQLAELRKLNIGIFIDDFGTGYSSLNRLRELPVNAVKIDRSFISEMGERQRDTELVKTIIDLSHSFGMLVVAEGVETRAQLDLLTVMHCDLIQGYLIGPPMPADDIHALVYRPPALSRGARLCP